MSSTTLFTEKGSVTTTLRAANAVRKNAIRNRRRRGRRSTSSPRPSSELIAPRITRWSPPNLQTSKQPLRRDADRPGVQQDVVVGGDENAHHHEENARRALDRRDQRAVALEEAQEEAEPEREGEERHAEPRRIGQEQAHAMPHRALTARQGEDGAEYGADARCPSNGEGQADREGPDEAGGLVPDL